MLPYVIKCQASLHKSSDIYRIVARSSAFEGVEMIVCKNDLE